MPLGRDAAPARAVHADLESGFAEGVAEGVEDDYLGRVGFRGDERNHNDYYPRDENDHELPHSTVLPFRTNGEMPPISLSFVPYKYLAVKRAR